MYFHAALKVFGCLSASVRQRSDGTQLSFVSLVPLWSYIDTNSLIGYPLDPARTRIAAARIFAERATHAFPPSSSVPVEWRQELENLAQALGYPTTNAEEIRGEVRPIGRGDRRDRKELSALDWTQSVCRAVPMVLLRSVSETELSTD